MTDFTEEFEEILGLEKEETEGSLSRQPEVIDETDFNDLSIRFVTNLKVRSSIPKVQVSYFSNSKVKDAYGDILEHKDGEVKWDKGTPGHQHPTDGIVFLHPIDSLQAKLGTDDNVVAVSAAYSAGYGLRAIASRKLGIDSLDIQCSVTMSRRFVRLTVHDADVGGAGLSHAVYKDINDFLRETRYSLDDCVCSDFCEKCLLLPRTPTHLVEQGVLNRFHGLIFLSD